MTFVVSGDSNALHGDPCVRPAAGGKFQLSLGPVALFVDRAELAEVRVAIDKALNADKGVIDKGVIGTDSPEGNPEAKQ